MAASSRQRGDAGMTDFPDVSIVIPVRNEARAIIATLEACLSQDYEERSRSSSQTA